MEEALERGTERCKEPGKLVIMEIQREGDVRRMNCAVLLHGTASYNVMRVEIIFLIWHMEDFW